MNILAWVKKITMNFQIFFVQFLFVFSEREYERVPNNKIERKNQEYIIGFYPGQPNSAEQTTQQ
jgi:hypothetical protein